MYLVTARFEDAVYMLFLVKASHALQARRKVQRFIEMEEWSGLETLVSRKLPSQLLPNEVKRVATILA